MRSFRTWEASGKLSHLNTLVPTYPAYLPYTPKAHVSYLLNIYSTVFIQCTQISCILLLESHRINCDQTSCWLLLLQTPCPPLPHNILLLFIYILALQSGSINQNCAPHQDSSQDECQSKGVCLFFCSAIVLAAGHVYCSKTETLTHLPLYISFSFVLSLSSPLLTP